MTLAQVPDDALMREVIARIVGHEKASELLATEAMRDTPRRMLRALVEMTAGYGHDPAKYVVTFEAKHDELVLLEDITFYSLCEHHVLPFFGTVAIAYIPQGRILGLSKAARMVRVLSRRFQVQERLVEEIADAFMPIDPKGVAVLVSARHLCCSARGAESPIQARTSALRGVFRTDPAARAEVMALLGMTR